VRMTGDLWMLCWKGTPSRCFGPRSDAARCRWSLSRYAILQEIWSQRWQCRNWLGKGNQASGIAILDCQICQIGSLKLSELHWNSTEFACRRCPFCKQIDAGQLWHRRLGLRISQVTMVTIAANDKDLVLLMRR